MTTRHGLNRRTPFTPFYADVIYSFNCMTVVNANDFDGKIFLVNSEINIFVNHDYHTICQYLSASHRLHKIEGLRP